MEKPESGIRNRSRKRKWNLNWDQGKLGSTETSSRYPSGNKIQDGVLCYHCFEKFSAQWLWYQRYTHIWKVTCKKTKRKYILLLSLAVIKCDCSCRSSNFQQIETTTNQKPIDCKRQPCLRPLCYSFPSLEPKLLISKKGCVFHLLWGKSGKGRSTHVNHDPKL